MSILCTICALGGSSGIKNKNIKKILNYPLIIYTIKTAINSKIFDKIVLSTDSEKIMNICSKYDIEIFFKRPKKLSGNNVNKVEVIRHALLMSENYFKKKFDYICDLDVSSPLRTTKDIKKSFELLIKKKSPNIFSVIPASKNPYFNIIEYKNKGFFPVSKLSNFVFTRQKAPKVYSMNASIYIWQRYILLKSNTVFNKNSSIYSMNEKSVDIDTNNDFELVDYYIKKYTKWQIKK